MDSLMERERQFGDNVRAIRQRLRMSQEELAHAADLHFTAISRIELAMREPRLKTILKLADALGVPPGDLFTGIAPRPRS